MRTGLKAALKTVLIASLLLSGTSLLAKNSFEYRSQKCWNDWIKINANVAVFGKDYGRKAMVASYNMFKHNCSDTRPKLWKEYRGYYHNITVKGY